MTSRKIIIGVLLLAVLGYGVLTCFEYIGSIRNRFLTLRQDDLRNLGKIIQEYARDNGDYPNSFQDLINAGRMTQGDIFFVIDGHRVSRVYRKPKGINPPRKDVIVTESYDFLEGKVNTLAADGYVCLQKKIETQPPDFASDK